MKFKSVVTYIHNQDPEVPYEHAERTGRAVSESGQIFLFKEDQVKWYVLTDIGPVRVLQEHQLVELCHQLSNFEGTPTELPAVIRDPPWLFEDPFLFDSDSFPER